LTHSEASYGDLFISCGEISGDGYAAAVTRSLKERGYCGRIYGMAGPQSRSAGVEILWDSRLLHLMGIVEVMPSIPRLFRLKREMVDTVLRTRPATVLVIDSPDFHLRFIESLRSRGWRGRVVYAVPPTVWAWRAWRVRSLARNADLCLPLFRFEDDFLREHGVSSAWRGHPLVDEFAKVELRRPSPPDGGNRRIALFPGSRGSEIRRLLPPLKECAALLKKDGFSPVFSIAPGLPEDLRGWMRNELHGEEIFEGDGRELLASSTAAAGASGTVAVEAMMTGRFFVVLYKVGILSLLVWKLLGKTRLISLPNILAGEIVYPELLQKEATGKKAFSALRRFLFEREYQTRVERGISEARKAMGEEGASDFWAGLVLSSLSISCARHERVQDSKEKQVNGQKEARS
jgi:lipid-A-disaccharide synthase